MSTFVNNRNCNFDFKFVVFALLQGRKFSSVVDSQHSAVACARLMLIYILYSLSSSPPPPLSALLFVRWLLLTVKHIILYFHYLNKRFCRVVHTNLVPFTSTAKSRQNYRPSTDDLCVDPKI